MNVKKSLMVGLVSVAMFASASLMAKPYHNDFNMYRMMLSERGTQKLDLTDTQVEQIKRIYEAEKQAASALKEKRKEQREIMQSLIQAEFFDREAYLMAVTTGQSDRAEFAVLKASNKHKIRYLLTVEQQIKFDRVKQKRRNKMKQRMVNPEVLIVIDD